MKSRTKKPSPISFFVRYLQWLWRCQARQIFQALIFSLGHYSLGRSRFYQSTKHPPPPQVQQNRSRTACTQAQAGSYSKTTLQQCCKTGRNVRLTSIEYESQLKDTFLSFNTLSSCHWYKKQTQYLCCCFILQRGNPSPLQPCPNGLV